MNAMFNNRTLGCLFCKKLSIAKFLAELRISNAMFNNLQKILQRHSFLMSRRIKTKGCLYQEVKQIQSHFADRG